MDQFINKYFKVSVFAILGSFFVFALLITLKILNSPQNLNFNSRADLSINAKGAILHTSMGDLEMNFNPDAPNSVNNFIKFAEQGLYNGTRFHRIVKDLLIQGGDPISKDKSRMSEWGHGGPGYTYKDEFSQNDSMIAGTVALANNGPDTNGSQFFILVKPAPWLLGHNTIIGNVLAGQENLLKIQNLSINVLGVPKNDVFLESVQILR